jgi:hypothetical protein
MSLLTASPPGVLGVLGVVGALDSFAHVVDCGCSVLTIQSGFEYLGDLDKAVKVDLKFGDRFELGFV